MAKIRISTDSTADIPQSIREELAIPMLPITILAQGQELRDGVDAVAPDFYDKLESWSDIPTTSQTPVELYVRLFEETLAEGYTHLIHVSINSKGSGTYQAGLTALDLFYEDHPEAKGKLDIRILDSRNYSMAYGIAVIEGARMIRDGAEPRAVLEHVQDYLDHAHVLVIPLNLRFAKRSGRVNAAAAFVGDALGLKPIITFEDGESKILAKVRGEGKAIAAMVDLCLKGRRPGTSFAIAQGNNQSAMDALRDACLPLMDLPPLAEYYLGCVISMNIGPDAVGIIYRS